MPVNYEVYLTGVIDDTGFPLRAQKRWLLPFAELNDCRVEYLVCQKNGNLAAVLPVFIKKKKVIHPPLVYYQFLAYFVEKRLREQENVQQKLAITEHLACFLRKNFRTGALYFGAEQQDLRAFLWHGYQVSPQYTYVLDLKKERNYSPSIKKAIGKAEREEFSVKAELNTENTYELFKLTFKRQAEKFPYEEKEYEFLIKNLYNKNILRQFNIYNHGIIKAVYFTIEEEERINAFLAAAEPALNAKGISTFMIDKVLDYYKDKRQGCFDFCGANIAGIAAFKSGFGGSLQVFWRIKWSPSFIKRLL